MISVKGLLVKADIWGDECVVLKEPLASGRKAANGTRNHRCSLQSVNSIFSDIPELIRIIIQ